jgi:hypothetical protein
MIIIGVDYHPAFQQIALLNTETGEFQEKRLAHREEAEKFDRWRRPAKRCGLGWRPAGTHAGSNDCWLSYRLSCGSVTQHKYGPGEYANKRPIGKMRS